MKCGRSKGNCQCLVLIHWFIYHEFLSPRMVSVDLIINKVDENFIMVFWCINDVPICIDERCFL